MIKIFRKIRQKLVNEGKTTNYLKYAIGEILLVVVGILIALQVNNWNENKKNKTAETVYLKEMLKDFEINLQRSNEITIEIDELITKLIGLLEQSALEKPNISLDSINKVFTLINSMPTYTSTDRVYNNLIGSGDFKLITNGELKTELANYNKAVDLIKLVQSTHEMELVNSFQPYIIEFLDFQSVVNFRVKDYQLPPAVEENKILDIIGERHFRNIITLKLTILSDLLNQNINIKQINLKLVNLIKKQIN
jgi:hypothetical protein